MGDIMADKIYTEKEEALDFNKPFGLSPETKGWLRKVVEKIEEEMRANKMTNEMKLLRAFIEASGYEIESNNTTERLYRNEDISITGDVKENAIPERIFNNVEYKVTKKEPPDIPMTMIEAEEYLRKIDAVK